LPDGEPGAGPGHRPPQPTWIERVQLAAPGVGQVRVVCVDGPAGSGKTTLAASLAAALGASFGPVPIVHGDEVYEGWPVVAGAADRVTAFRALADRVDTWLLSRWRQGEDGEHPRWDWHARTWGGSVVVPPAPVVILEGVALASRTLRTRAALSIWVEAEPASCLARVLERDGDAIREEMLAWQLDEALWHRLDETRAGVDVRVRGD
jgi:uridine kinase